MKRTSAWYKGFSPDTPDEDARAAFAAQFGYPPEEIVRNKGAVLAGPIRDEDLRRPTAPVCGC